MSLCYRRDIIARIVNGICSACCIRYLSKRLTVLNSKSRVTSLARYEFVSLWNSWNGLMFSKTFSRNILNKSRLDKPFNRQVPSFIYRSLCCLSQFVTKLLMSLSKKLFGSFRVLFSCQMLSKKQQAMLARKSSPPFLISNQWSATVQKLDRLNKS